MASSCILKPCVKDGEGNIVESKLFNSLLSQFPKNREEAWRHYDLATDEKFIAENIPDATFDEYGEIKFNDYVEAVGLGENNPSVEQALNTELKAGNYSRQEALEKVAAFNRNLHESSQYMATLRINENGSASIFVAQRTDLEVETLKNEIRGLNLNDKILALLAQHGVAVKQTSKNFSRYSTKNATRNANGLYQLIEFCKEGSTIELAEEAGHFIVGAMTDTPLGERLEAALASEEVQRAILGKEYDTKDLGDNPAREVAGVLVGKALVNKLDPSSPFFNLVNRLINAAKKIFAKISGNQVKLAILEAETIAEQYATEFINEGISEADIKALKTLETLYHKEEITAQHALKQMLAHLQEMKKEFEGIHSKFADNIETILKTHAENLTPEVAANFTDNLALAGIFKILFDLQKFAIQTFDNEQNSMLASPLVRGTATLQSIHTLQNQAKELYTFTLFSERLLEIIKIANLIQEKHSADFEKAAIVEGRKLKTNTVNQDFDILPGDILSTLNTFTKHGLSVYNSAYKRFLAKARVFSATWLEQIYGKKYVARQMRLSWSMQTLDKEDLSFDDIVRNVRNEDGLLQHLLGTLANSGDEGAQLIAKLFKEVNYKALLKLAEINDTISKLEQLARAGGFHNKYRRFYEVDEEGQLTGNLKRIVELNTVTDDNTGQVIIEKGTYEINMAKYDRAKDGVLRILKEEFIKSDLGKKCAHLPATVKRSIFKDWVAQHDIYNNFIKENTIPFGKGFLPDPRKYGLNSTGTPQTSLNQTELNWLKEYNKLWKECQSLVGKEKMPSYFAPQVKGSKLNTTINILKTPKILNKLAIALHLTGEAIKEVFVQNPEIVDKQAKKNYRTEAIDPIDNFFEDDVNLGVTAATLLPIYYVRKLKDTTRIDTNLLAATMHFATMATKYQASATVQNSLGVTVNVLSQRTNLAKDTLATSLTKALTRQKGVSYVQASIDDHVEALFYERNKAWFASNAPLLNKFFILLNQGMTYWYLGGNVISQLLNLLNGYWEIFKEALVGENITLGTFLKANALYVINSPLFLYDLITTKDHAIGKWGKINVFLEKFAALGSAGRKYADRRTWIEKTASRYLTPSGLLLGGYSLAEHYMQAIPYMCVAMSTTIYNKQGKRTNLWNALSPVKHNKQDKFRSKDAAIMLDDIYFKDLKASRIYKEANSSLEKLKNKNTSHKNWDLLEYAIQEELKKQGIDEVTYNNLSVEEAIQIVENLSNSTIFDASAEATFVAKAQEVTNRMHGVYNHLDKTVMHRSLLGMLLLPFKGYSFGMIQRRFGGLLGGAKYNIALDHEDEGSVTTSIKAKAKILKDIVSPFTTGAVEAISKKDFKMWLRNSYKGIKSDLAMVAGILPMPDNIRAILSEHAGVSVNQIYNIRRNLIDHMGIYGIFYLLNMVQALVFGEDDEDDEKIEGHTIESAMNLAYSLNLIVDEEDASTMPDYYMTERDIMRAEAQAEKLAEELDLKYTLTNEEYTNFIDKQVVTYIITKVNEYKQVNRKKKVDPLVNIAYYMLNRFHREQSAFNTWLGFKTEGKQLLNFQPLSFNFAYDVYTLVDNFYTTHGFTEESTTIAGKQFTVEQLFHEINSEDTPKKLKQLYKKEIINVWVSNGYGSESEFNNYYYTQDKKGHHQYGDNKATTTLNNKLIWNRLRYTYSNPHSVRDYNFGVDYK